MRRIQHEQDLRGKAPAAGFTDRQWRVATGAIGAAFAGCFAVVVVPALVAEPDVAAAFAAGFVNPFAAGYSLDVLACYALLVVLVLRDRRVDGVRGGWVALVLGVVPGVAVGLAAYLLMRARAVSSDGARRPSNDRRAGPSSA